MGREFTFKLAIGIAGILGIIVFIRIASDSSRKVFMKTILTYTLGLLLVMAAVRTVNFLNIDNSRINYSLYQLLFLLVGVFHCYLCVNHFFKGAGKAFLLGLTYTISITLLGALVLLFVFQFTDQIQVNYLLTSSIVVFPLPYIVYYTYYMGRSIPFPVYDAWRWPIDDELPDFEQYEGEDSFIINLILSPSAKGVQTKVINCKVPVNLKFGDFFYAAISEYNERENISQKVDVTNEKKQPFSWRFYEKSNFFWRRDKMIDYDLSIFHNELNDRSEILCKRVGTI